MVEKFGDFRDTYLQYIVEYNKSVFSPPNRGFECYENVQECRHKLYEVLRVVNFKGTKVKYQVHDTFANRDEKEAYLKSIKTFILLVGLIRTSTKK